MRKSTPRASFTFPVDASVRDVMERDYDAERRRLRRAAVGCVLVLACLYGGLVAASLLVPQQMEAGRAAAVKG